jgi:hypothetical protein
MSLITPAWLRSMMNVVEHDTPALWNKGKEAWGEAQTRLMNGLASRNWKGGDEHLSSAQSMTGKAFHDAVVASRFNDEFSRLLHVPKGEGSQTVRGALSFLAPEYYSGTPMTPGTNLPMAYVESLGAPTRGAGQALLRSLAERYPDNPIGLHAIPTAETLDFYKKRGFQYGPHPEGSSSIADLPFMYLPHGGEMKRKGGLMRLKECMR